VQVVSEPLPSENSLDREARVTVGKGQEEVPASDDQSQNNTTSDPSGDHALARESLTGGDVMPGADRALLVLDGDLLGRLRVKDEFEKSTGDKTRSKVSWKVMMQKKLSSHEEEGEVVGSPGQEEEAGRVIQARAGTAV
jgi:hypothetical protein